MATEWSNDQPAATILTDVKYFDKYLEGLESVSEEGKIIVKDDNIFSMVVGPSNVVMCVAKIQGTALKDISIDGDDEVVIGSNFEEYREMLSGASSSSELELMYPYVESSTNNLRFNIVDDGVTFNKPAVNKDMVPDIPDKDPISHNIQIEVSGKDIKKAINHASKVIPEDSGSIVFGTDEHGMYIKSSDKVKGSFRKDFTHGAGSGDLGEHSVQVGYSFMQDMKRTLGRSDVITVHIRDNYPLRFDLNLDDAGDAKIIYIIAPRTEKD